MLSILGNWLYMGVLVFLAGSALIQGYLWLMGKLCHERETDFGIGHVLFAGIMAATLYAQIFSVFYRVNIEANLVLVLLLAVYAFWQRRYLGERFAAWRQEYCFLGKWRKLLYIIAGITAIVFAMSSAGPDKLVDTIWYHAQTIHWIEEYGCVRGTANLLYSLGYNNAQHYFDALFSMKWLLGQSLKGTGGFFGLVIFLHGLLRVCRWKRHAHHCADMLAVWEMGYSIIVTAFYTDPYVDTLPNALVFFILTEWFGLLEEKKEDTVWFGFYCLLAVFAVVCKTSVAMTVLLSAYPVYLFVKKKKARLILFYLGAGFLITIPFMITNVIVTGYPVYLLSALDFFDVPWKIDPAILEYSVDNMVAFARMPEGTMEEALNCGLRWVPSWFRAESVSHQILYLAVALFVGFDLIYTVISLFRKKAVDFWMLYPRLCVYAGLAYWFMTIPQVKYCWSFLIFPIAVIPAYYLERKLKPLFAARLMQLVSFALLLMYVGFYSLRTLGYMKEGITQYPVMQADYRTFVFEAVEKGGHTFYIRIDDGGDIGCGYYTFPYVENKRDMDRLVVGDSLREGFYFDTKDTE